MIKSAKDYSFSQLFDIEGNIRYNVPRYQREYTWIRAHWESLFDDILENDGGYFLGSIICINQTVDALWPQLEVVDGQQRLISISLLLAAVYENLNVHEKELNRDQEAEITNTKRKLVLTTGDGLIRIVPQIQNKNQDDYRAVLGEIGVIDPFDAPPYAGNRKIFRAFRYFKERVNQLYETDADSISTIMAFLRKINQSVMVKIEVDNHSDAYTLFESLNNRGMPLTAIDLIKNRLLSQLEAAEPGKIDFYFDRWKKLLEEYLGDDYEVQERFFRQYYNAFKDKLKAIHQVPMATRSNLIQIYEKLITHDPQEFLQKISNAGRSYSVLLNRSQEETQNNLGKSLEDLERIQGAPAYLLLLYLLGNKDQLHLADTHMEAIIKLLVRFFVRRNLTDTPPTRDLNRIFMSITGNAANLNAGTLVHEIRKQLVKVSADEHVFRGKLEGPIYDENIGVSRFILCAFSEKWMTRETWVDLWKVENKKYVWTIEHIFPQGENIPQDWIDMIADGDKQKAKEYQEQYVHKLGNLTISGFNSALGNMSFIEKRDRKDSQGRYVGYRNGLKLNEGLPDLEKWSIGGIHGRTTRLVNEIIDLFRLDDDDRSN